MHARLLPAAALAFLSVASVAAAQATSAAPTAAEAKLAASSTTAATPSATGDLIATAQAAGTFSTFLKAAELTKLTPVLKSAGPITVFAPTDAAFAALPAGELDRLMKSPAELQKLLLAHVVNTKVLKAQIAGAKGEVQNGAGANLAIDGSGDAVKVNGATIVKPDVLATNGVIHVIDRVMLPAGATAAASTATTATADASTTETPAETEPAADATRPATTPPTAPAKTNPVAPR